MTQYLFSNNATTTLAESISATATTITVSSGDGSLFPSPSTNEAFSITLVDAATGLTSEICYCTARSSDTLTVTRGEEGTSAVSWLAGDTAANYLTAGVLEAYLSFTPVQQGGGTDQTTDKVYLGADSSTGGLRAEVAGVDLGVINTGRLLSTQIITSNSTYTPDTLASSVRVRALGGGGGGGGSVSNATGTVTACSGGAAGSYAEAWFDASTLGSSVTVTIGAAGLGTTATGGTGGTTTFGSFITAPGGGGGGVVQGSSTAAVVFAAQGAPGSVSTVTGATQSVTAWGQPGMLGYVFAGSTISGQGAPSPLGGGGTNTQSGAGNDATGYGAGGSGAAVGSGASTQTGGDGSPGVIIIEEYS